MTTPYDLLIRATELHQAGRLLEAGRIYRYVLSHAPDEANALHLLGLVNWRSTDDPTRGEALIRRAIALVPAMESFHLNLGNLYRAMGRTEAAIAAFERGVEALPGSLPLLELFCGLAQDRAVLALKSEDRADAIAWAERCFTRLPRLPALTPTLYQMLERQIQIALVVGRRDIALAALEAKNRFDFPGMAPSEIEIFALDLHGFPEWCAAEGLRAELWQTEAQPVPETLFADYPDYLHVHVAALPDLGRMPVGVALDAEVEVVQGFYVKDNYESFVLSRRRSMLCENKSSVVRSPTVPIVGVTPEATAATFRLPRGHYRVLAVDDPCIFVPSTPNYWHFMVEVLPQLIACSRVPEAAGLPIALFDVRGYQNEMFDLARIDRRRVIDMRAAVGTGSAQVVYRFRRAAIPSQIPYPVAYRWLRETMLPKVRPDRGALPRRVFLSRRGSYPKHRIANDTEVGALLERHGFTVVKPEALSVLETIELIAQAEMVVAPIGAGTSNHIFLPPYGTWIHLNNPDFFHPDSPWNGQMGTQATLVGTFRHLTGRFVGDPATFPDRLVDRLEIPIEIDLRALEAIVDEAESRLGRSGPDRGR